MGILKLTNTKGGKVRDIMVRNETYEMLENLTNAEDKIFHIAKYQYIRDVKAACIKTSQQYNGPHGFRWCFARNRMVQIQASGYTYEQALLMVGREMGHERGDITELYLS